MARSSGPPRCGTRPAPTRIARRRRRDVRAAAYKVPNFFIESHDVVVNKPKVAAYRAPGAPIAAFAVESVVDEIRAS